MAIASPRSANSNDKFAICLYHESNIQNLKLIITLHIIKVKKTVTRTSELITSLKAILRAIKIHKALNHTKYVITIDLFMFNSCVTYDNLLTFHKSLVHFKWKNT